MIVGQLEAERFSDFWLGRLATDDADGMVRRVFQSRTKVEKLRKESRLKPEGWLEAAIRSHRAALHVRFVKALIRLSKRYPFMFTKGSDLILFDFHVMKAEGEVNSLSMGSLEIYQPDLPEGLLARFIPHSNPYYFLKGNQFGPKNAIDYDQPWLTVQDDEKLGPKRLEIRRRARLNRMISRYPDIEQVAPWFEMPWGKFLAEKKTWFGANGLERYLPKARA